MVTLDLVISGSAAYAFSFANITVTRMEFKKKISFAIIKTLKLTAFVSRLISVTCYEQISVTALPQSVCSPKEIFPTSVQFCILILVWSHVHRLRSQSGINQWTILNHSIVLSSRFMIVKYIYRLQPYRKLAHTMYSSLRFSNPEIKYRTMFNHKHTITRIQIRIWVVEEDKWSSKRIILHPLV